MAISLLDLLVPAQCVGCDVHGAVLCHRCSVHLRQIRNHSPRPRPPDLPVTWAAADYVGSVRSAILSYKEKGQRELVRPLADGLIRAITMLISQEISPGAGVLLVPVPSSALASWARGGNQVMRLVKAAANHIPRTSVLSALAVAHRHQDSVGLSATERAQNLRGAFRLRPKVIHRLSGRPIVLVDDVITTGSTLTEAARVIRGLGGDVRGCAVVAAASRSTRAKDEAEARWGRGLKHGALARKMSMSNTVR